MRFPVFMRSLAALLALACGAAVHARVTTRTDTVGKLLNEWHKAGTAAGLAAITYENRDGGHSPLDAKEWPQLQFFPAEANDRGPAKLVRPIPLLGNCSMASAATQMGSLPRIYLLQQPGWSFLAKQYSENNHFIYPEHQDHDPGWNGRSGWGDLFPANTPCLTLCQGSSYNDKVFLRAYLSAMAAFPSDTQKLILEKKLLAPTLQMLLRHGYNTAKAGADEDYFTGARHPVVFDGTLIDEERMVRLAHAMTPDHIPPVVRLEIIGGTQASPNRDFFEAETIKDESQGMSPFAIGRILRHAAGVHGLSVTAKNSTDVQNRPLKFKWVVLQGDPKRVTIQADETGKQAKILVRWHPEFRAASGIQTHRVDIGVFAQQGEVWSAPALLSFYMLPNEVRFYNGKGLLEEICYDAPNPDPGLPPITDLRWMALGWRLGKEQKDPGVALLTHHMSEIAIVRLQGLVDKLAAEQETWRQLSTDEKKKKEADKALGALQEKLRQGLEETFDTTGRTIAQAFEDGIRSVAAVSDLYLAGQDVIPGLVERSGKPGAKKAFEAARKRMVDFGIFQQDADGLCTPKVNLAALTAGEKYHLAHFHFTILNLALLPELLDRSEAPAYVDRHLTTPKTWRDLHHHGDNGQPAGWTRIMDGRTYEFDAEGRLFPQDQSSPATHVKYVSEGNPPRLVFVPQ